MLEKIVTQEVIFYVMAILLGLGVLAKLISAFTVRRMVKAAGEIQKSNHKLMKLVKAKFEHASMISDKVQNVEAFVDKYIYEYKVFGVRLQTWRGVPKLVLWIIGILGVFASFECYRLAGFGDLMMKYVQWTGLFVMFLFLLYFVAEEKTRLAAAKNYMVEYLENVCIHRYTKLNKGADAAEEAQMEGATVETNRVKNAETEEKVQIEQANTEENLEEEAEETSISKELERQAAQQMEEERRRTEQEMRIRAILEEFLA